MTLWGALTRLRAEKTPIEPDLGHASVGKYEEERCKYAPSKCDCDNCGELIVFSAFVLLLY